jgi:cation diffusion facilitator family transporter
MTNDSRSEAERRGLITSVVGAFYVGVNGVVFYLLTGAEAILLDGLFNLTYFVTGLFAIKVARMVLQGDDDTFPVGYAFFEPLVNGSKGVLMLGVTVMALISAVEALFTGGREIVLGWAVLYGVVAVVVCWSVALLIRRAAKTSGSPLVRADAANWIVNAAISSAVLGTLLIVFLIRDTSLRFLVDYVDPLLVLIVGGITLGVPVRMAWGALMELLNRTPSPEVLAQARTIIEAYLEDLPVTEVAVRVIQPGRTRIVSGHVLLPAETAISLSRLDDIRERIDSALKAAHPTSVVDLLFTGDRRWSAPLTLRESTLK